MMGLDATSTGRVGSYWVYRVCDDDAGRNLFGNVRHRGILNNSKRYLFYQMGNKEAII